MKVSKSLLSVLIGCSLGVAAAAEEPAIQQVTVNIDESDLSNALIQFTKQTGLQLIYPAGVGAMDLKAPRLSGTFSTSDALAKLLKDSGLRYEFISPRTVAIRSPKDGSAASENGAATIGQSGALLSGSSALLFAQSDPSEERQGVDGQGSGSAQGQIALEEVVVTAQRREERLQDVPISISVLGGDQLDSSSVSVLDELRRVPGLAGLSIQDGTDAVALSVRGVTSTANQFGGTSTVGYYLDSVPFGFVRQAFSPDSSAYDLERVEVLRGPQGTLYGVNAANGVVRVLTKDPNLDDFEAKFRVATSMVEDGGQGYRADGAVNMSLVPGKLAARAVVGYEDSAGWVDAPYGKDINDRQASNVRLKLKAMPTDKMSLDFMAWHSESDGNSYSASLEDRSVNLVAPGEVETTYDVYVFDVEYEFPHFAFTSSSSYIDYGSEVFAQPATADGLTLESQFTSKIFAQEIALNSTSTGPWTWSVGAIYRDVTDSVHQNLLIYTTGVGLFPNRNGLGYKDLSDSYAVFGQLTRSFHDGFFSITAGLRYFEDENGIRQTDNLVDPTAPLITSDAKFDSISPRAVFNWHASDTLTAYASYAEGFRSGFGQSPSALAIAPTLPAVQEDNLTNYEVGAKGSAFDGLVSFDAAVFYIDWENTQLPLGVQIPGTDPVITLSALVNFQGASGPGAEAGVTFRPASGLDITLNASWNDLAADTDAVTLVGTTNVLLIPEGGRLPYSPEWTGNLLVDYEFSLGNFEGVASGGVSYLSEMPLYFTSGTLGSVAFSEESWISRASFAVRTPNGWTASLFVENLTDENVVLTPSTTAAISPVVRPRPRTIGLQFEYKM